jgi:hypothetical protein
MILKAKGRDMLDYNDIYNRDKNLIEVLIKELEIDYKLDFMLDKFKSMFLSVESTRSRAIAVFEIDNKKTKRIQVKTISSKSENKEELIYKLSIFISLFRQLKSFKDIENLEKDLKIVNQQLLYNDYGYFKEIK